MRNKNGFEGNTFVAFLDIAGFKDLMRQEEGRAKEVLNKFYKYGYRTLLEHNKNKLKIYSEISGLFISDCGILYVKNTENKIKLKSLLHLIKEINLKMLDDKIMLITSIAFGQFAYKSKPEHEWIEKKPIYGDAYLSAYLDTEKTPPKMLPGQCRIIKKKLPPTIKLEKFVDDEILSLIKRKRNDKNHFYFYWNVKNPLEIPKFEKQYLNAYNSRFDGILEVLKRFNFSISN